MNDEKLYPTDEIQITEEFIPYVKFKDITGGHKTYIKVPNRYDIELTVYDLMPGISVILNRTKFNENHNNNKEILQYEHPEDNLLINYVVKGQCQIQLDYDKYMFVKENDITLFTKKLNSKSFIYIGEVDIIQIVINKKQFKKRLPEHTKEYYDLIIELFKKAEKENITIFSSPENIQLIVEELITSNFQKKISYILLFHLKILELLVKLYEYDFKDEKINQRTYTDAQIRVVRNIKNSLSRNIASYISLDQLSASYGINLTTLKNCFKDMYGKPLYTWYKEYKFYRAKELIKNTDYPISKIANMIGYKSSSKFAKAFKKEMGVLPSSLRKNKK